MEFFGDRERFSLAAGVRTRLGGPNLKANLHGLSTFTLTAWMPFGPSSIENSTL
jgi:hypothetical protein